jgi:hypothetical protein
MTTLLTQQTAKLSKTHTDKVQSVILYLDPLYSADMCKGASATCRKTCLIHSGRMRMDNAKKARRARTEYLHENPTLFNIQLQGEIMQAHAKASRQGKKLDVRLNGTSDLDWSHIYRMFPDVQFHEYTKRPDLALKLREFKNVHVTFSKHENHTDQDVKALIDSGVNVAVVFKDDVPNTFKGIKVINGDAHDRRWEDAKGIVVGLKIKGTNDVKALAIKRGFAV